MKCPHCLVEYHEDKTTTNIGSFGNYTWFIDRRLCPACKEPNFTIRKTTGNGSIGFTTAYSRLIHPMGISRSPVPPEVPDEISKDYKEACLTISESPQASAALSRRCLQHLLREYGGVTQKDLAPAIQQTIDEGKLPSHLLDSLDAVRQTGNFAAHPIKSTSSGEIIAVEPGEAEWNLDILEELFDYFFVQPERIKKKKEALNKKLKDAGKPTMKES